MERFMELVTEMSNQESEEQLNIHYGVAFGYLECLEDQKVISHETYIQHWRALVNEYYMRLEELES